MRPYFHFIPIVNQVERLLPIALKGCCLLLRENTIILDVRDDRSLNLSEFLRDFVGLDVWGLRIETVAVPLSTAQAMNCMLHIAKLQGHEFFTWQHLDAECTGDVCERLPAMVNEYLDEKKRWGVMLTNYDAYAAFNVKACSEVGGWDWLRFPFYFLDNDMYRRLANAGYPEIQTDLGPLVKHEASQTIKVGQRAETHELLFRMSEEFFKKRHPGGQ